MRNRCPKNGRAHENQADRGGGYTVFVGRMNAEQDVRRAVQVAGLARRKLVMITKIRESEQWRYYTERVRPLMGPDDPEPREQPLEPRGEVMRPCMARDHERLYRRILTGERTSRAMPPTPVA